MNPLSLAYYTVPELDPAETVSVAAENGCAHVGLRLLGGQPGSDSLPVMTSRTVRAAMRGRLRDTGVSVLDANTARLVPSSDVGLYRPFFEVAAELGARHALATGNDPCDPRLAENLDALCNLAEEFEMTVQLEFVPWLSIASLADAFRVVTRVDRRNLGIAVDALHFDRAGSAVDEISSIPSWRFAYMHWCDAPTHIRADRDAMIHTATRERLFPGEGSIDLVSLLRALPAGIPLSLEIPTESLSRAMPAVERVARAVAATRRILDTAGQMESMT